MSKAFKGIETKRLKFEEITAKEIPLIIALEQKPENKPFIWKGTYESHLEEITDPDTYIMKIIEKDTSEIVGFLISVYDYHSDRFEFKRYVIDKKGKGYGEEGLIASIVYAFENMNTNKFWLDAYNDNDSGNNLYRKIGLHCDGVLRQNHREERGLMDQIQYSLLREEYDDWKKKYVK